MAQTPGPVTLTDADLALLRSMPWCASVLHCIATDTMHNLEHVREACQYLSSRCFICGLQLPRTQDLHHHFRTEHPAYWDRVPTKAMILSNIHSSESPCPHCGGIFKKHQCPFWTQISIMSLYGGSLVQPTEPVEAIPEYRCDICLELHPDAAQLARHLQTKHKLAGMTFNVSRDSLDAQAACAHCGSTHASMEGLRSHITQGRCPCFNPAAEAETTPVSQDWLDICLHGKMLEFLQSPMTRLHWTIRCQQCPKVYARAGDLANHLMNSHSRLWRQAQGLTLILVDLLFARRGCTCNPQIHQQRQNHICVPLRQIAMIYYRLHQEPFMPIQLPDTVLEHLVHPSFSADVQARLRGIFTNRTFTDLWTAQDVLQILSNACTICGQDQHPGELCRHLHEAHVCGHRFVDFYTDTLLQTVTMTFQQDHQCVLCQQVFNLPASSDSHETAAQRQRLVQAHLKGNCPVFLQCALLLGTALNGGGLGFDWMGRDSVWADPRTVPVPCADLRQEPQTAAKSKACEAQKNRRTGPASQGRSRSARTKASHPPDAVPPNSGATGITPRAKLELDAKHRLFHPVFPAGTGRSVTGSPGDTEMESATPDEHRHDADPSATAPLPMAVDRSAEQGHEGLRSPERGPDLASLPGEAPAAGGPELALPTLGPCADGPGDRQEEVCLHEENVATPGRADPGFQGPNACAEIPRSSNELFSIHNSVETPTESQDGQTLRTAVGAHPLSHLDASGIVAETTQCQTEQPGQSAPTPDAQGQRGRQREDSEQGQSEEHGMTEHEVQHLCQLLAAKKLANSSNWCFANATMYCLCWTLLSLQPTESANWGKHFERLTHFLKDGLDVAIQLVDLPWFAQLLECWGRPPAQQDCSEFVNHLLQWLSSPAIDMGWQRRCETDARVCIQDSSDSCMPLFVQFPNHFLMMPSCKIDQLIRHWSQVDGMQAALLRAAPIICIHVDRLHVTESGLIEKSSCAIDVDSEVPVPSFLADGTTTEYQNYVLIAAASHLGQDASGHYQAILKVQPTLMSSGCPVQWLVTQDNERPAPHWQVPEYIRQNLTVLWLLRVDSLKIPTLLPAHTTMPETLEGGLEQQILTLLQREAQPHIMAPSSAMQ